MTHPNHFLIVSEQQAGSRLDTLLARQFPDFSRTYFQYLIDKKLVLVNGSSAKKRTQLAPGDEIEVEFALTEEISLEPEDIPLDILYEDEYLLAINKPAGLVVHPAVGNWRGTFVNALLYHCKTLPKGDTLRPGIVHRLDKETTGLLLAAKTTDTQQKLVALFAERKIEKTYLAICLGNPGNQTLTTQIGRHPTQRKKMTVLQEGGKEAITRIETETCDGKVSVVHLFPKTGRTHQLRVHLKALGCPILGDTLYGNPSANTKYGATRQLLHAQTLKFTHPQTGKAIHLEAPIPKDMHAFTHPKG